jgi:hypothetical protein
MIPGWGGIAGLPPLPSLPTEPRTGAPNKVGAGLPATPPIHKYLHELQGSPRGGFRSPPPPPEPPYK